MIFYAKNNAVKAKFQNISIFDFKDNIFESIVMDAFLHLFPKVEVTRVLSRVNSFLVPGGYGLVSTTQSKNSYEGYFEKEDYKGRHVSFRKYWTKEELKETLEENGLEVVNVYTDYFNRKDWMNLIFKSSKI